MKKLKTNNHRTIIVHEFDTEAEMYASGSKLHKLVFVGNINLLGEEEAAEIVDSYNDWKQSFKNYRGRGWFDSALTSLKSAISKEFIVIEVRNEEFPLPLNELYKHSLISVI